MDQFAWIMWAILGILLVIAEIFTLGFVLFWFGIGAFAAALAGYLGVGMLGQFLVFATISTALTIMSRTIFEDYFPHREGKELKTGIDTLPGQIGTIHEASKGALHVASVKVYGSTWKAFPENGEATFEAGEKVEVVRVKGSSIYVKKTKSEQLSGWRDDD